MNEKVIPKLMELAAMAMTFGKIDRTYVYHPSSGFGSQYVAGPPESDSDHTVMLGWLAVALAEKVPGLSVGRVALFALIHDLLEVFTGDIPTLRFSVQQQEEKEKREEAALDQFILKFQETFPDLVQWLRVYENRGAPEARFVWALDKCAPKFVHLLDGARGLREARMGAAEFRDRMAQQRATMREVAGEFPELIDLHEQLSKRVEPLCPKS